MPAEVEILCYGEVGADGFSAASVRERLAEAGGGPVDVRSNSSGGDAFEGRAVYAALNEYSGRVTVYIDGLAASAASLVAMAGDEIVMAEGAFLMLHAPSVQLLGNADALRRHAETLDEINEAFARSYSQRSNASLETVHGWLAEERWFSAEEAVAAGLADRIEGEAAAIAASALARFRHVPEKVRVRAMTDEPAEAPAEAKARERIASILDAPEAEGRDGLARFIALKTTLPVAEAKAALAAAPTAPAETPEIYERRRLAERGESGRISAGPENFDTRRGRAHGVRSWDSYLRGGE
jgi:ATP-dependent protease ClpP protease subunit